MRVKTPSSTTSSSVSTPRAPESYGEPSEQGYYKKLAAAFLKLVPAKSDLPPLVVELRQRCVGAYALTNLIKLSSRGSHRFPTSSNSTTSQARSTTTAVPTTSRPTSVSLPV